MEDHNNNPEISCSEIDKVNHFKSNGNGKSEGIGNITITGIFADAEENNKRLDEFFISDDLQKVLRLSADLRQLKKSDIEFANPILQQSEFPVFFPRTINLIQGQAGAHKSRLAEIICSALLKAPDCNNDLLGFNKVGESAYKVIYVDTERNLSEQLPYSLQKIQSMAGFRKEDDPSTFDFISLVATSRKDRFSVLVEYLKLTRHKSPNEPLFVVLDVSTDCIEDFNRPDKSLELIDEMNMAINESDIIFLCIIHENPGTSKARGHFGTELLNKATVAMQVSFEKNGSNENTDVVKVKYLKCRTTAKHPPFYVKYDDDIESLVTVDQIKVDNIIKNRKTKVKHDDLLEFLQLKLGDGNKLSRRDLLDLVKKEFKCEDRTSEERLKDIIDDEMEIINDSGIPCKLEKANEGKEKMYFLKPLNNESYDAAEYE